ncbi:MAG: phenylalanine--tRNA ligase subunit beta, partial [bacterium]
MKVTYNWLKAYANFDFSPDELVDKLTMLGLEVDSWNSTTWDFDGVVVGEIMKKEAHQHSNKLWVCEVNVGARNLSIVCGAPNVKVGLKVPVAPEGTHLPTGKTIRRSTIRGVESQGMICSEAELGISSRSEGVMVLDTDVEFGKKLSEVLGEGEIVIDIDVTPNRPDCFGVIGIAREIAALAGTSLNKPNIIIKNEGNQSIKDLIKINILNPEKCPRYTARFIGNVTIKPSPWWLAQKLEAVGIRSINNVVDITNYVMMETGQPLHAFDYELLNGHAIHVKTASEGQLFTTLDEKTHTLNSECLMICDGEKEVAIGGIMGGLNSEVSLETKNILLESAYFDPVNIRRTAKFLGISTESSRRFERGTDPNGVLYALDRAAQLIAEMAEGEIAKGFIDVYPSQINSQAITLRTQRVQALLGIEISSKRINEILTSLHFIIKPCNAHEMQVKVPTFRPDIKNETDLIEEVARVYGYENVPADTLAFIEQLTPTNLLETFTHHVQNTLISLGFSQVATYSLLSQPQTTLFADDKKTLKLI